MENAVLVVNSITPSKKVIQPMNNDARLRFNTYSILASLLSNTPSQDLLDHIKHIKPSSDDNIGGMGQAWQQIRLATIKADINSLDDEYHALFIGLGRGVVVPFGSWHITGFLMDKPLSDLRDDLKALGIESDKNQKDPEDHIAALFESMALIIDAGDISESWERQFFARHIYTWAGKFFKQLIVADVAKFYKAVGFLGQQFIEFEHQYLNIQTH